MDAYFCFDRATKFRKNHKHEELEIVKDKFNLPEEFLLNVGTIETRKNLISLINAMDLIKIDIPLVVVGKKTAYKNFLKIQIKKLNFDPNKIIFLDNVSINELPAIYKLSSLFVYPSIFEGFGIPPLEAAALGSKVICSNLSAMSNFSFFSPYHIEPKAKNLIISLNKIIVEINY